VRVLLIGSTGVLGRPAARRLLAAGHDVTGLARNAERADAVRALGIQPVVGDLFDPDSLAKVLVDRDAVLNLATRIPTTLRAQLGGGWKENDRIRNEGSQAVVDAALRTDVRVIVQEGISFVYADGGDKELDEEAPIEVFGPIESSVRAHRNVAAFADHPGRTGVGLRIGILLSAGDAMSQTLVRTARFHGPTIFGDGWTTAIQPDDAAAAAVAALDVPSGVYNVGAAPVRKADLGKVIAGAAGVRRAHKLPKWLAGGLVSVFARSQRVVSGKLSEATGWHPERPLPSPDWFK
jgi:nucleoside-diphosphate-sugar epimerase